MMTDSSMAEELIQYISENINLLDPMLDFNSWEVSEDQYFDASTLPVVDIQNPGFRNNVPTATCTLPSVSRLVGSYDFGALISPVNGPDCLYSIGLNKIYVNINKNVPVQFRLSSYSLGLYIRALVVFITSSDQQEAVTRCITHEAADEKEGRDLELLPHVLRCTSSNSAVYYKDEVSGRFSVCVPVEPPQRGMESFTVCYKFTCLNSCQLSSGRQRSNGRRGMGIIFTLENEVGEVFGRQFMNVRVCSCPKRDKEKEEKKIKEMKEIKEKKVRSKKRPFETTEANEPPKKFVKPEPGEIVTVKIPVKACNIKELAKFASDLIYRDVGMQQRQLNGQEKSLLAMYNSIIEAPEEEVLRRPL